MVTARIANEANGCEEVRRIVDKIADVSGLRVTEVVYNLCPNVGPRLVERKLCDQIGEGIHNLLRSKIGFPKITEADFDLSSVTLAAEGPISIPKRLEATVGFEYTISRVDITLEIGGRKEEVGVDLVKQKFDIMAMSNDMIPSEISLRYIRALRDLGYAEAEDLEASLTKSLDK